MSNNSNKVNSNPMKVITDPTPAGLMPTSGRLSPLTEALKFSVSLIIPKSDTRTIAKIKAAIEAAYREGEAS